MATLGSFASKNFIVSYNHIYTFDELTMNGDLSIEEQEVEGSKPSTYIKGQGLDKVAFSINLVKQQNIDVKKEIDDWDNIKNAKVPYSLVIGNKKIGENKFLLTNTDKSEIKIAPNGEYLSAKIQLQFSEYVRAGKKETSTSSSSGSSSAGTTSTSKQSKKRSNNNAKTAKKSKQTSSNGSNSSIEALEKELYG